MVAAERNFLAVTNIVMVVNDHLPVIVLGFVTNFNPSSLVQHLNTTLVKREHTYLLCLHKTTNKLQKEFQ